MHADCLPGACVTVRVDGEALTEHATENDQMSATTFIKAVAGAEFDVALNLSAPFAYRDPADRIRFQVNVDGDRVRTPILRTHFSEALESIVEGPQETLNGVTTFKQLMFAQHASTDHRADNSVMEKLTHIGTIRVTLQRCRAAEAKAVQDANHDFTGVGNHAIPEKALKGRSISSHTELGRVGNMATPRYIDVTYPYGETPIATYIFHYRSHTDLQIEGIIERTPSPVPLEERDPDELTPDELRELVRRSRAEKVSASKVKQEFKSEKRARASSVTSGNNSEDEGDVTITSHTDRRKRMRASMEAAETIDLTED